MKNKIRSWLIDLANVIGDKSYYDFGEPIEHLQQFGNMLVVSTKTTIYYLKEADGKWKKISKPPPKS